MSVSRSLKPFIEKELLRPPDWFSQKSCAMQYAHLLENTDTPKRKKRESGETTSESIVRKLKQERITELNQTLVYHKNEYLRLKSDLNQLKSGAISDESLENMWHEMQQEERETEQKTRLHVAWLKRQQQQKQEMGSPSSSIPIANQTRKLVESVMDTTVQEPALTEPSTENDDEKKSNRGGRSPLLTSLLKSPSPTTQTMQTFSSTSVQVSSPTITSLLGSSPKILNTQLTQNVSPQLQQLVSTAIASGNANVTSERPSVGAPTLSMLLEMPASAQRGPLPNLQTTNPAASIQQQQQQQQTAVTAATTTTDVHNFQQTVQSQPQIQQTTVQNATTSAATAVTIPAATTPALTTLVTAPTSIPVSENMVQIIDHIDDVIRKDIMTDVIDKDEINEIIGDIEELIKKEITHSPQTLDTNASTTTTTTAAAMTTMTSTTTTAITTTTMTTTTTTTTSMMTASTTTVTAPTATAAVIGGPAGATQQTSEIPIIMQPKSEPRDVDEAVSLSDSPQSEMAIEEIDSSTSNIAEIIGTVAIEPQEPKIIVAEITEPVTNASEETKPEASICDEKITEDIAPQSETNNTKGSKNTSAEGKQPDAEVKSSNASAETAEDDSKLEKTKQTTKEIVMEKVEVVEEKEEEKGMEVIVSADKESSENVKEQKEPAEKSEGKNNARLDRVEMHLTKLTGNQPDVPSTEVVSVSSEVMNDVRSTEDTEKSQDISLENDESSQNSESKKKAVAEEQQVIENTTKSTESLESLKDESAVKDKIIVEVKEELSVKSQEEETVEETLEIYTDEFKKEEIKDSSEDTASSILPKAEIKKEEIGSEAAEDITRVVTVEEVEHDKSEPVDATATNTDVSIKKAEIPEPKLEPKAETEPEASGLFRGKSPVHGLGMEEEKKEKVEIKEEKEDVKKTIEQNEQSIKKEIETTVGEEPGELDEEESSLSKLSSARAMKTYSKRQNVAMDSEPETEGTGEGADYRAWKKAVMLVYNRLATHKYASVFLRPITEDQAPGYHSVIFRPMDLLTIKKNIDNGTIRSTMHFQRDVMLMFQNAIMYNKHDTFIYKMAVSMQEECLQHMQVRKMCIILIYRYIFTILFL